MEVTLMRSTLGSILLLATALALAGCGYHVGAHGGYGGSECGDDIGCVHRYGDHCRDR
jgi:hypothetical protein